MTTFIGSVLADIYMYILQPSMLARVGVFLCIKYNVIGFIIRSVCANSWENVCLGKGFDLFRVTFFSLVFLGLTFKIKAVLCEVFFTQGIAFECTWAVYDAMHG